jgi:hypothetical protein
MMGRPQGYSRQFGDEKELFLLQVFEHRII